jgi:hypothetical protein
MNVELGYLTTAVGDGTYTNKDPWGSKTLIRKVASRPA